MAYPLFSFTSTPGQPDPSAQAGLNQYIQQGQSQIDPGKAQVAQSSPIAAAGTAQLAQALRQMPQQQPGQPLVGSLQNPASNNAAANASYNQLQAGDNAWPLQQAMSSGLPASDPSILQRLADHLSNWYNSGMSGGSNGGS